MVHDENHEIDFYDRIPKELRINFNVVCDNS